MTLRLRLMLLVGTVVIASLAAVFFGSTRLVRVEIQKLEDTGRSPDDPSRASREAIRAALAEHYAAHGWTGIDAVLQRLRHEHAPGRELLLVTDRRTLVGASSHPPGGLRLSPRGPDGLVVEYAVKDAPVRVMVFADPGAEAHALPAALYVVPEWRRQPLTLSRTINQRLLLLVAGIGALALLATAFVARTVVRPIEQLQAVVRKVSSGALGAQVSTRARDEVGALASAFNAMSAQLARDDAMRRNMVNDVAHELRTPLTRMRCTVEAVQDGLRPADSSALAALHGDLTVLQRLVEDLETLALAEAGKLPLHPQPVEVSEDVARWLQTQPEEERRRIDLALPPGLIVDVDHVRFQQIVTNLVRNALLHGGPAARVRIGAEQHGDTVRLAVSDDGPGIGAEHLPHVFDRFYRADAARGRSTGGSGLGLAIVKQLVELHGGRVSVESEAGRGTTFLVVLKCSLRRAAS